MSDNSNTDFGSGNNFTGGNITIGSHIAGNLNQTTHIYDKRYVDPEKQQVIDKEIREREEIHRKNQIVYERICFGQIYHELIERTIKKFAETIWGRNSMFSSRWQYGNSDQVWFILNQAIGDKIKRMNHSSSKEAFINLIEDNIDSAFGLQAVSFEDRVTLAAYNAKPVAELRCVALLVNEISEQGIYTSLIDLYNFLRNNPRITHTAPYKDQIYIDRFLIKGKGIELSFPGQIINNEEV
jgi:hypothetical protein